MKDRYKEANKRDKRASKKKSLLNADFVNQQLPGISFYNKYTKSWYLRNNTNTDWILVFKENNNIDPSKCEEFALKRLKKLLKKSGIKINGKYISEFSAIVNKRLPKGLIRDSITGCNYSKIESYINHSNYWVYNHSSYWVYYHI